MQRIEPISVMPTVTGTNRATVGQGTAKEGFAPLEDIPNNVGVDETKSPCIPIMHPPRDQTV